MHICPLHSYFKQSLNDQVEAWLAQGNEIKNWLMVKVVMPGISTISQSVLNQLCVK
ncbi:TPA: hypothetical protein ACIFEE_000395 [Acinetobacter baumannii]